MKPLLAVVIPTYNRVEVLQRAVRSVLSQTAADIDLIVVDDGSTDSTLAALDALQDPRLRIITQQNSGVCAARNAGASATKAQFLVFLDSDDEASPGWVDYFYTAASEDVDFAACAALLVNEAKEDQVLAASTHGAEFGYLEARFLSGAFGLSTKLFDEVGGFRAGLRYSEHTDLALRLGGRMLESPFACRRTDEPLVKLYPSERSYDAAVRYDSAVTILREDAQHLQRSPDLRATYEAIAGIAASRLGDRAAAREHLIKAIRLKPARLRNYLRLGRQFGPARRAAGVRSAASAAREG